MEVKFNVESAPHVKDSTSTMLIMLDVIIALLPVTVWGVISFGKNALLVMIASVLSCVLFESLFNFLTKKTNTVSDLSAVVTGMILALNMPPEVPIFVPIVGSAFAILIVKMLFGGLGQNFMNPALAGRCFCLISFPNFMNNYQSNMSLDAYSMATPLKLINTGHQLNAVDLFMGYIPGTIGETSKILLLLGAAYLIVKKIIDIKIPVMYLLSFVVFLIVFSGRSTDANYILGELLSGGLIFGAFFMATDYATSPITPFGKIIYGFLLGILTGVFRVFGKTAENVSFVILIMNLFVPLIESWTIPIAFGKGGK